MFLIFQGLFQLHSLDFFLLSWKCILYKRFLFIIFSTLNKNLRFRITSQNNFVNTLLNQHSAKSSYQKILVKSSLKKTFQHVRIFVNLLHEFIVYFLLNLFMGSLVYNIQISTLLPHKDFKTSAEYKPCHSTRLQCLSKDERYLGDGI